MAEKRWGADDQHTYGVLTFRDGAHAWCIDFTYSHGYTFAQLQRVAAILNGELEPKAEGPWRVEERYVSEPSFHHWAVHRGNGGVGLNFYSVEGFTREDAELLASRRNAHEAQVPKPRYEAVRGSGSWYVYDSKLQRHPILFSTDYPGGPEAAARAEAARLNAAEGGHGK